MDDILNVLVVEDEKPIREDLALFPWDECGAILIGEAANGREALEACEDVVPDVIVTDITMPYMDGLQLMEEVGQRHPDAVFIILSCHEDFEYAQKALRLGAVDYVTKVAMQDEDLKLAVDKARERLQTKRKIKASEWREEYWDRTSKIRAFLAGKEELPGFVKLPARLAAVQFVSQKTDATFANRYCQSFLEREKEPVWFSPGGMRYVRMIQNEDEAGARSFVVDLVKSLQDRADEAMPYLGGDVRFFGSVTAWIENENDLRSAVDLLDTHRGSSFYDEQQLVFAESAEAPATFDDTLRDKLTIELQLAEKSTADLISYLRNGFIAWGRKRRVNPDQLKSMLISRREGWKGRFISDAGDDRFWMRLSGVSSLGEFAQLLCGEMADSNRLDSKESAMRQELISARRIIRDEYAESLTLTSVADRVGLSPSYLSRLFSNETGRTFKDFLTEVRMAKAMELLRRPGMKVYEVAEAVGVPSYRHFSSIFRGMTGLRPKDFQRGGSYEN